MYGIYSNKRRGAYLIFRAPSAALIPGRRLSIIGRDKDSVFSNCTKILQKLLERLLIVIIRLFQQF